MVVTYQETLGDFLIENWREEASHLLIFLVGLSPAAAPFIYRYSSIPANITKNHIDRFFKYKILTPWF